MDIKHVLAANPLRPAYAAAPRPVRPRDRPGAAATSGSTTPAASSRSATTATGSPSTTSGRATTVLLAAVRPRAAAWSPTASGWPSSTTAATSGPSCGCPTAGRRCRPQGWEAPALLGARGADGWSVHTLAGPPPGRPGRAGGATSAATRPTPSPAGPGAACPTEAEWEAAAAAREPRRALAPTLRAPPAAGRRAVVRRGLAVDGQPVPAYPGFAPAAGAVGEYNGKFMVNQQVLRGGACVTPARPHAADLPQLLLPGVAAGRSAACGWPSTGDRRPAPGRVTVDVHLGPDDLAGRAATRRPRPASSATPKTMPPVWFYDDRGCELYEEITRAARVLPVPHRAGDLLRRAAGEIAAAAGATVLVELGLGHVGEDAPAARRHGRGAGRAHRLRAVRRQPRRTLRSAAAAVAGRPRHRRACRGGRLPRAPRPASRADGRAAARGVPRQHHRQLHARRSGPGSSPTWPTCSGPTTGSCWPPTWSSPSTGWSPPTTTPPG